MENIQWPLALFTLFTAMGGCLFLFVAVNEFTGKSKTSGFVPGIVAGVIAIIGGFCSVLHLAHVDRIMNALSHPTSGIFVEAVLVGCLVACIFVYLICLKREIQVGVKAFAALGGFFGIALSFMAGHSYVMDAIAAWNTQLLPLGYLLTALPMGAALYWAIACKDEVSGGFMARCTLASGVLGLIGTLAYTIAVGAFTGDALPLSIGAIVLAGVAPIVIGAIGIKKPGVALAWTAFACSTVGACMYRLLMWVMYASVYGFFGASF